MQAEKQEHLLTNLGRGQKILASPLLSSLLSPLVLSFVAIWESVTITMDFPRKNCKTSPPNSPFHWFSEDTYILSWLEMIKSNGIYQLRLC